MSPDAIQQIDAHEGAARTPGSALLLDVLNPNEFDAGHAPHAVLIPLPELTARMSELDANVPIVVICRSGGRSQAAAELLAASGYDVVNLIGGMQAWQADGLDVVANGDQPGTVL